MAGVLLFICSEDTGSEKYTLWNRIIKYVGRLFYVNIKMKSVEKKECREKVERSCSSI